jgi:hypothetical protein
MVQDMGGCSLYYPIRLRCATVAEALTNPELEDALARALGRAFAHARAALPAAVVVGDGVVLQPAQLMKGDLSTNDATALLARVSRAIETATRTQALPLSKPLLAHAETQAIDVSEPFDPQRYDPVTNTYDVPSYKGGRRKVPLKGKPLELTLKDRRSAFLREILVDYYGFRKGPVLAGQNRFLRLLEHLRLLLSVSNPDAGTSFSQLLDKFSNERLELLSSDPNIGPALKKWEEHVIEHGHREIVADIPADIPTDVSIVMSLLMIEAEAVWETHTNIHRYYQSKEAYWLVRDEVSSWTDPPIDNPAAFIEEAIEEWETYPDLHEHFGDGKIFKDNFDADPHSSYLNLKRLYKAVHSIEKPLDYIKHNMEPFKLTLNIVDRKGQKKKISRETLVDKGLKNLLEQARNIMGEDAFVFGQGTFVFVPRTYNDNINKLSNHALGKAIDIDPGKNPHIKSKDDILVINAVCSDILPKGLEAEKAFDVQRNASIQFQKRYKEWKAMIEQRYLDMTQKTRPVELAYQASLVTKLAARDGRVLTKITELDYVMQLVKSIERRLKMLEKYATTGFLTLFKELVDPVKQLGESLKSKGKELKELSKYIATRLVLPDELVNSEDDILVINAVCSTILPEGLLAATKDAKALQSASDYFRKHFNDKWISLQKQRLHDMTEKSASLPSNLGHQAQLVKALQPGHDENKPVTELDYVKQLVESARKHHGDLERYATDGFLNLRDDVIKAFEQVHLKQGEHEEGGTDWGGKWPSSKDYMHFELTSP